MEPGQYTGKTNATQGEPAGDSTSSASVTSPAAAPAPERSSVDAPRPPTIRPGGNFVRLVSWGAVIAVLVAGLVMYFRYERSITPLFGQGR
jgi:hypothetical protein